MLKQLYLLCFRGKKPSLNIYVENRNPWKATDLKRRKTKKYNKPIHWVLNFNLKHISQREMVKLKIGQKKPPEWKPEKDKNTGKRINDKNI